MRGVLHEHGRLNRDALTLDADADLYQAGMSSHASVNVMLGLEATFGVEFPDHMLRAMCSAASGRSAMRCPTCRGPQPFNENRAHSAAGVLRPGGATLFGWLHRPAGKAAVPTSAS